MDIDLINALGRFDDLRKAWLTHASKHIGSSDDALGGSASATLLCARQLMTLIDELSQASLDD